MEKRMVSETMSTHKDLKVYLARRKFLKAVKAVNEGRWVDLSKIPQSGIRGELHGSSKTYRERKVKK